MSLRALVLLFFFLSGATGLLYQVLWTRLLGTTIGNTHFSITVVVSVFMGGLALGSWLGGRVADRSRNPLRLYGVLNLLGALLCLVVPFASDWGRPAFRWLYQSWEGEPQAPPLLAARIAFSALLIIAPTTCMGATLPALARYFTQRLATVGMTVGALYTVNTFGAVAGVFFAGFWAMEHWGVTGTTALAVAIDVVIGGAVIVLSRNETIEIDRRDRSEPITTGAREATPDESPTEAARASSSDADGKARARAQRPLVRDKLSVEVRSAVIAFGISGFANMLLQVAWTKAIVQTIGNSTYAFSLIVTLFILGIGIGGAVMTAIVDRLRNPYLALGIVITLTAILVSATVPLLGWFPILGARLFDAAEQADYDAFLRLKILMVAVALLPATTAMGAVFPLVSKIRTRAVEEVGSAVGSAYFANTVGAILGTLAAGFVFVPLLGRIYRTLYLGAAISLLVGIWILATARTSRPKLRLALVGLVLAATLGANYAFRPYGELGSESPSWDPAILSKGPYVYYRGSYWRDRERKEVLPIEELVREIRSGNEVLSYVEGIHAPVAVVHHPLKGTALRISGKVEASLPPSGGYNRDMPHQIMAGHLPMMLHPRPEDVLTLGLGGGVTLGTLTLYPAREIDSLEISAEVIDAAREYFDAANRGALGEHPLRPVRHIVGDGRNHLLYTSKRYDVITSVPSNPWIAGIGTLFTREFFEICKDRLEPGGIVCNWIHKINMRTEDIATVFRTFVEVFGDGTQLWDLGYDCLLIGSNEPIEIDVSRIDRLLENPEIRRDLASVGIHDSATFLRHFRWNGSSLRRFAGEGPLNTDAFPVLEFSCPRGLYGHPLDAYRSIAETPPDPLAIEGLSHADTALVETAQRLQTAFSAYQRIHWKIDLFERAYSRERRRGDDESFGVDSSGRPNAPIALSPTEQKELGAQYQDLVRLFSSLCDILDANEDPWLYERISLRARSAFATVGSTLEEIVINHFRNMARHSSESIAKIGWLERALEIDAVATVVTELTKLYIENNAAARGLERLEPHVRDLTDPRSLNAWGIILAANGRSDVASQVFDEAFARAEDNALRAEILANLGFMLLREGRPIEARRRFVEALELSPNQAVARYHLDQIDRAHGANASP
ncbi:MAG TPA: fused MFS/spermidine synthase [Planctomycetota bacterium]|nr:fused MFS/spermidine synthase [Planctomycetota bacterium]